MNTSPTPVAQDDAVAAVQADPWLIGALRCVGDAVVVVETDARVRYLNPAAEALSGWSLDAAKGRPLAEVMRFEVDPSARPADDERDDAIEHGLVLLGRGGLRTVVDRSAAPVEDELGRRRGAVFVLRDATERLRREASESASRLRGEALSRIGHEMRTPLNAVLGFGQLMQVRACPGRDGGGCYVDHIVDAGRHLLGMVDDLLEGRHDEPGAGLRVQMQPVDAGEAIGAAMTMLQPLAEALGVEQRAELPAQPAHVRADPRRLRQVLLNLGSNAVKYNRPGGRVRWAIDDAGPGPVRLTVHDDGIGMAAFQLDRLFQPFDRLGREASGVAGTGLGLVITKGLVERMGGRLEIDSQVDRGTTVTVLLTRA
ncbi:MAG TPA: ATP-binding protein [Methylibium sp.]|uniref:sensor histidine kinase n=1 Tax=Methylibium sp. TaxID=2067992 RepID=UPI002DBB88E6|nr:ATP-binding protein [Methylibium sp.]HEU4458219.1 ATP-binding protein [Methylibium sp.]